MFYLFHFKFIHESTPVATRSSTLALSKNCQHIYIYNMSEVSFNILNILNSSESFAHLSKVGLVILMCALMPPWMHDFFPAIIEAVR